jgi:hypothetical protein
MREYRPRVIPRRGELFAWGGASLLLIVWVGLIYGGQRVIPLVPILSIFFIFAGVSISLGNWVDRMTRIQLTADGIWFYNGLRKVDLSWKEIKEVHLSHSQLGTKVHVDGENEHFSFRTLAEIKVQGELKGQFGFENGETILRQIILNSRLDIIDKPDGDYYYARK